MKKDKVWYIISFILILGGIGSIFDVELPIICGLLMIIIGLAMLPIINTYVEKIKYGKVIRIVLIVLLMVLCGSIINREGNDLPDDNHIKNDSQTNDGHTNKTQETITEQLENIFEKYNFPQYDNLTITYNGGDIVLVKYHIAPETVWTSTSFIRDCFGTYVSYCMDVYKNVDFRKESNIDDPNTTYIKLIVTSTFIDSYGNEKEEVAFRIEMKRDKFENYDWNNLQSRNLNWEQIKNDCDVLNVHNAILKDFNTKKFFLVLYSQK